MALLNRYYNKGYINGRAFYNRDVGVCRTLKTTELTGLIKDYYNEYSKEINAITGDNSVISLLLDAHDSGQGTIGTNAIFTIQIAAVIMELLQMLVSNVHTLNKELKKIHEENKTIQEENSIIEKQNDKIEEQRIMLNVLNDKINSQYRQIDELQLDIKKQHEFNEMILARVNNINYF